MGEARKDAFRVGFDNRLRLEFHGAKVSTDGGLFPYRELDDAAQLTESGAARLIKIGAKVVRHARYVTFQLAEVAAPRDLFRVILDRIGRFRSTPVALESG